MEVEHGLVVFGHHFVVRDNKAYVSKNGNESDADKIGSKLVPSIFLIHDFFFKKVSDIIEGQDYLSHNQEEI